MNKNFVKIQPKLDYLSIIGKQSKFQSIHKFGDITFQVDKKYVNLQPIGRGSGGSVVSAFDSNLKIPVAIKKVDNAFRSRTSAERTYREIFMLRQFDHENILKLIEIERPLDPNNFNDVYVVTELLTCDLRKLIYCNVCFNEHQIKNIMYQIIKSVLYLHGQNILHRDIKPSNILVDIQNGTLKLADFGLSTREHKLMDKNVVTRWYRAPELMFPGNGGYDKSIDMWSVGCVFAELILRRPLFCGNDNNDQLKKQFEILGVPKNEELKFLDQDSYNRLSQILILFPQYQKSCLREKFGNINPYLIDFISKCLKYNPFERLTVCQAMKHQFFKDFFEEKDFLIKKRVDFSIFDHFIRKPDQYRRLVNEQITKINNPMSNSEIDESFFSSVQNFINSDLNFENGPDIKNIITINTSLDSDDEFDLITDVETSINIINGNGKMEIIEVE